MKNEKGFTLIELLVVIAIIGILAAIAIPQFASYRQRAFDSRAQSDLRNVMTAEEAYFVDNEEYTSVASDLIGFTPSDGVSLNLAVSGNNNENWNGDTEHGRGSRRFCYSSSTGGGIADVASGAVCP